jgi:hypothetical protein
LDQDPTHKIYTVHVQKPVHNFRCFGQYSELFSENVLLALHMAEMDTDPDLQVLDADPNWISQMIPIRPDPDPEHRF